MPGSEHRVHRRKRAIREHSVVNFLSALGEGASSVADDLLLDKQTSGVAKVVRQDSDSGSMIFRANPKACPTCS